MASEIRANSITSRAGLSTVTMTDSGPMFSGITTFVDNSGFNLGTGSSIFTPASNTLTFGTNSNERLRIQSDGDVSFGDETTGRAQIKHVSGDQADRNNGGYPQYAFVGNEGTGMRRVSSNVLAFDTTGDERARLDASGSLIIGGTSSSSATEKLRVENDSATSDVCQLTIISGNAERAILNFGDAQDHNIGRVNYDNSDNHMSFFTDNTERLRITSAGSIGINSTSPDRRFTLYQDATTRMNLKSLANSTTGIEFGDPADHNIGYIVYDNTDDSMQFGVNAGERLRITSSGTAVFGGNAAAPIVDNGELYYRGNSTSTFQNLPQNFYLYSDDKAYNATNPGAGLLFGGQYTSTNQYTTFAGIHGIKENNTDNNYNSALVFGTRQQGSSTWERLRINSDSSLLHTRTDNTTRYDFEFRNTGGIGDGNYGGIHWTQGSTGGTSLAAMKIAYQNSGQPDIVFYTRQGGGTSSSESVRFTHEGDLLLNQNGNDARLGIKARSSNSGIEFITCRDTSGNLKFYIASSGATYNSQNTYGGISDLSLKENIVDANSQWNDVKNIKVRNFNFTAASGIETHTQIGCIAQEVEAVSPKLVKEGEGGMKTVSYSILYMKAIKALQEAMTRIETLEQDNIALRVRVTNLEGN